MYNDLGNGPMYKIDTVISCNRIERLMFFFFNNINRKELSRSNYNIVI